MTDFTLAPGIDPQFASVHERFFRHTSTRALVSANPEAFSRLFRRQCQGMKLTTRAAARLCGVSHAMIWQMQHERTMPSAYIVESIIDGLAITRDDILAEIRAMQDEEAQDEAA